MTVIGGARRPGGRAARVRRAVLTAAIDLLVERPGEQPTVNEVAARAGVHETSIYRRWGTREKLIIDALLSHSEAELPIPDTGSLRGDLEAMAAGLIRYVHTPLGLAQSQVLATPSDDPAVLSTRETFWERRLEAASIVVVRAIERGEAAKTTDPTLVVEILVSVIHGRSLISRRPMGDDMPRRIADIILSGVAR